MIAKSEYVRVVSRMAYLAEIMEDVAFRDLGALPKGVARRFHRAAVMVKNIAYDLVDEKRPEAIKWD